MCYAQTKFNCGMLHSSGAVLYGLHALYAVCSVLYVFMCAAMQASWPLLQLCMLSQVSVSTKCAVGAKCFYVRTKLLL